MVEQAGGTDSDFPQEFLLEGGLAHLQQPPFFCHSQVSWRNLGSGNDAEAAVTRVGDAQGVPLWHLFEDLSILPFLDFGLTDSADGLLTKGGFQESSRVSNSF